MSITELPVQPPSGPEQVAWLRENMAADGVQHVEELHLWNVFTHAEAKQVLNDTVTFSSDLLSVQMPEHLRKKLGLIAEHNLARKDPPEHRGARNLFQQAFTARMVTRLEPRIREMTDELLDEAGTGRVDVVDKLTYPLPITVIAELLGIPTADRDTFRWWVDTMIGASESDEEFAASPEAMEAAIDKMTGTVKKVEAYLLDHTLQRREAPLDDLISRLTQASVDGVRLSDDEVVGLAGMMLVAGHLTSTMLLGNCLHYLATHQDVQARLRADRSLIGSAIEEILRMSPSVTRMPRITTADVSLGGKTIPVNSIVMVWAASANRDPAVFAEPDRFIADRDPNPHLGFGHGIHFCLGASLARLTTRVALEAVFDRYPSFTAEAGGVEFHDNPNMVGLKKLVVTTS
ncbi:cytochrome P450 [Lentzea sp. NBRC 105346]|uniref:cytochrome P450 n=1 Tax=Lentzea sp. NBRC 105346 TaxID=3032205 RepID=UPI0024A0CCEA|nr:cytochrome P450 [Lentzea sp. NBRC 105346]GLZ28510.1 cytochrome P450 [Lentzea sp. NBRC 105346]